MEWRDSFKTDQVSLDPVRSVLDLYDTSRDTVIREIKRLNHRRETTGGMTTQINNLVPMDIIIEWRGEFTSAEVNRLHADAFGTRVFRDDEWDWHELTARLSLGWVTGRDQGTLVGFVNIVWDGLVHAWLQDLMVSSSHRRAGVGQRLVEESRNGAASSGCEWLHVDFDDDLRAFYFDACGFRPTNAGLMHLTGD